MLYSPVADVTMFKTVLTSAGAFRQFLLCYIRFHSFIMRRGIFVVAEFCSTRLL